MTPPSNAEPRAPAAGAPSLQTTVTYLEMRAAPARVPCPAPAGGIEVRQAQRPSVPFYRFLYDGVGASWAWFERKALSDEQLAAIIGDPLVEVHVLRVDGTPAGYAELDRRRAGEVELAYFGLMPQFIGQGLGRFLLDCAIDRAWSPGLRRLWVHTCDLDHPRALAVYQKAGFRIYAQRRERLPNV